VLAFADSDVRPDRNWLHSLTHVLTRPGIGASTGYRWFVPQRLTLPNLLVFSMNAAAAACLGRRVFNLIWGGSWAISRTHFEQLGLREVWRGTLNDDLVATRVVRGAGLKIDFEPRCLCPSPLDVTWSQALNFIHRQLLQSRYYATGHFWWGAAAVLVQAAAWLVAVGTLLGSGLVGRVSGWAVFACVCLFAVGVFRAYVGHATWREHFLAHEDKISVARRTEYLIGPLLTVLAGVCVVRTCFSNTMVWRGLRYRLYGGGQIMFLGRQLDDKACPVTCSQVEDKPRILPLRKNAAA
jgi:ceramide glucosyltransferase